MRGTYAKTNIKKGETILFVPEKIVITTEKAKKTPFGKALLMHQVFVKRDEKLNYPTYAMLALFNI